MKKILTIFAFAALLAGCKDLYGPTPGENEPVVGKDVTITIVPASVKDTCFKAEIVPTEKNVFCSFVLCKEATPSELDPEALLKGNVTGVKCALTSTTYNQDTEVEKKVSESGKGTFNAEKIVLDFGKLEQNTTYQLYAVAASSTGLPGKVVSTSVLTTDGRTPVQTDVATFDTDTTLTFVFSQPVSFVSGSKVEVKVFAENTKLFQQAQSIDSYDLADDDVVVGEDGVTVEINYHPKKLPAGAYFTVNYGDGAFISDTEFPCKGCNAAFTYDEKYNVIVVDEEGNPLTVYNAGQVEATTFDFIVPKEAEVFDPIPKKWAFKQNDEIGSIAIVDEYLAVSYTYGSQTKSVNLQLAYGSGWDYTLNEEGTGVDGIEVVLPELPETPGETITLEIPEGLLVDIYGNTNETTTWSAKFMQLDEIGTGLFSEPKFLGISEKEATLFYNPSTDVFRIADCFVEGYNLEFKWDRKTNKCEIIGFQCTGLLYDDSVMYVADAYTYESGEKTWEELEQEGYKQPYYEEGVFTFPNVFVYIPALQSATGPILTITYNMGRDVTKVQLEGVWTCEGVTDYWGDSYDPFDVTIQQAVGEDGSPIEGVYAIANLAPYLATRGKTAHTFGTWDAENSQLVIAFDEESGISAGGTLLTYQGFDNADPDVAEYYDDIYFSVSALTRTMVNLNAYVIDGGGWYEAYYGGAMKLKYKSELPVGPTNYVELNSAKSVSASPKAAKAKALKCSKGSFLKKGKAAFLMSAPKSFKLK